MRHYGKDIHTCTPTVDNDCKAVIRLSLTFTAQIVALDREWIHLDQSQSIHSTHTHNNPHVTFTSTREGGVSESETDRKETRWSSAASATDRCAAAVVVVTSCLLEFVLGRHVMGARLVIGS